MSERVQSQLITASQVAREASVRQGSNGVCFAVYGEAKVAGADLEQIINTVPAAMADALKRKAYYFVPLAIAEMRGDVATRANTPEDILISSDFTTELGDRASCHRNVDFGTSEGVFISARLMHDRFALAFEFFINVGHAFVDQAGVPESFSELVWKQAQADVRGETSQDAFDSRKQARTNNDEKARSDFAALAFADAIAIYLLSLAIDFDYTELREREYPLLAPTALAERLKLVAELFPPNPGYEFAIKYRRR
ncbi:MAG: hypothetical protein HOQ35_05140 [Acidobacteriaceae bacterium]|nr:hypothetical protein [Acidobacteriaceae bacterium]